MRRRWILTLTITLFSLLLILSFLPTFLSTPIGTKLLISCCRNLTPYEISAKSLSLSFFGTQKIEGLKIQDAKREIFFPEITSNATLLSILLFKECGTLHLSNGTCRVYTPEETTFSDIELTLQIPSQTQIDFCLSCHAGQGQVYAQGSWDKRQIAPLLRAEVSVKALPLEGVDPLLAPFVPQLCATTLLGPTLDAHLHLKLEADRFTCQANAKAEKLEALIDAEGSSGVITLKNPATLIYQVDPALISQVTGQNLLKEPSLLSFRIETLHCALTPSGPDLASLQVRGGYALSSLELFYNTHTLSLPEIKGTLHIAGQDCQLSADLPPLSLATSYPLSLNAKTLTLHLKPSHPPTLTIPSAILEGSRGRSIFQEFSLSLPHKDTPFSGRLTAHNEGSFSTLLGSTLTLSVNREKDLTDLTLTGERLSMTAHLKEESSLLTVKDTNLSWILTPEAYTLLSQGHSTQEIPFALSEPTTLHLLIPKATLQGNTLQTLTSSLKANAIAFRSLSSKEEGMVTGLNCNLIKGDLKAPYALTASLQVGGGSAELSAALPIPLSGQESICQLTIKHLPTAFLDLVAGAFQIPSRPCSTLLGKTLDAQATLTLTDLSGPLSCTLQSPQVNFSCKGHCTQGVFTLDAPLDLQIALTPAVSQLFLQKSKSQIRSAHAQAPITIQIPQEGVSIPLFPFVLEKAVIPKGRLELGQILCQNAGAIKTTLSLLRSERSTGDLPLWFAPLDWNLKGGAFHIERTEILLANSLDIAIWGNVDLEKSQLDMILGLTADALSKAFGLKGLPPEYVLLIPIQGPWDQVEINAKGATTKIALLLAVQNQVLSKGFGGGSAGRLLEGILGTVASLPDQDAKVPPAKHPFPWETTEYKNRKSKQAAEKKPKHFKPGENPLKQLLKVLK